MPIPEHIESPHARFCHVADEWFVSYAHLSKHGLVTAPMVFSLAMALELYFKTYLCWLGSDPDSVTALSHNFLKILEKIRERDPQFPAFLNLKPHLARKPLYELDGRNWDCQWFHELNNDDKTEVREKYELYMLAAYSVDLKYGIAPPLHKHEGRVITASWSCSSEPWIQIATFIRKRIGFPPGRRNDLMHYAVRNPVLCSQSRAILKKVLDLTHSGTIRPDAGTHRL